MKSPHDPRHQKRQRLLEELFRVDFYDKQKISSEAEQIFIHKTLLDQKIAEAAPEFPVEKINKVDLAILRLALYELIVEKQTPPKVILDEAIELAKEYGGETSPSFINGALGKLIES